MKKRIILTFISTLLITVSCFTGCAKTADNPTDCPFTTVSWDASVEDITALEGENHETYDSIYNGITYTYSKEYLGQAGMIKYMFDAQERLCNISWTYTGSEEEEVMNIYNSVCQEAAKDYGEGKTDDGIGNYCKMWVEKNETIMANAVITDDTKVMQIAYMRADVSKQDNQ